MDEATRVCINSLKQTVTAELRHIGGIMAQIDLGQDNLISDVHRVNEKLDDLLGQRDAVRRIVRSVTIEVKPRKGGDSEPDDDMGRLGFELGRFRGNAKEVQRRYLKGTRQWTWLGSLCRIIDELQEDLPKMGS